MVIAEFLNHSQYHRCVELIWVANFEIWGMKFFYSFWPKRLINLCIYCIECETIFSTLTKVDSRKTSISSMISQFFVKRGSPWPRKGGNSSLMKKKGLASSSKNHLFWTYGIWYRNKKPRLVHLLCFFSRPWVSRWHGRSFFPRWNLLHHFAKLMSLSCLASGYSWWKGPTIGHWLAGAYWPVCWEELWMYIHWHFWPTKSPQDPLCQSRRCIWFGWQAYVVSLPLFVHWDFQGRKIIRIICCVPQWFWWVCPYCSWVGRQLQSCDVWNWTVPSPYKNLGSHVYLGLQCQVVLQYEVHHTDWKNYWWPMML